MKNGILDVLVPVGTFLMFVILLPIVLCLLGGLLVWLVTGTGSLAIQMLPWVIVISGGMLFFKTLLTALGFIFAFILTYLIYR